MTNRIRTLALPLPLLVLLLLAATGLAQAAPPLDRAAKEALVAEFFQALNDADVAKLDALYGPDFEIWTAGALPISGSRTRAQALEGMGMIDGMFPEGLTFTVKALTIDGDRIAIEAESEGMHVSGQRYANQYHFLMVLKDGRIHRFKEYMDTLHARDVLLAPPAGAPAPGAPAPTP